MADYRGQIDTGYEAQMDVSDMDAETYYAPWERSIPNSLSLEGYYVSITNYCIVAY